MKQLFYPLVLATALVTTACNNDLENNTDVVDPSNKTAISFVGQNNVVTRAGFTGNTEIAMHIRSTKDASNIRETRTWATAQKDATQSTTSFSNITAPSTDNVRYWDDAYGRDAQLSVFAVAVPEKSSITNGSEGKTLIDHLAVPASGTWNSGRLSEEIAWTVSTSQSSTTIADEDLVYSNNISATGEDGVKAYSYTDNDYTTLTSGMLQFRLKDSQQSDGPGKFDQGNLKFNHALCRMTVNLKKGEGYSDGSFIFKEGTNVSILKVPVTGTFDVEEGTWDTKDKTGISKMAELGKKDATFNPDYALYAQMIPIYTINSTSTDNVLSFIIDNNQYYITQAQMFEALKDNDKISSDKKTATDIQFENGRNYVFNITVGKTKIISVTANVVDWVDVNGTYTLDNSHYSFELYNQGTAVTEANSFKFYRYQDETITDIKTDESTSKNWFGSYTASTGLSYDSQKSSWGTEWFFEDNTKFYHFRTTSYENVTSSNYHTDATNGDYFTMSSGAISSEVGKGTDYLWGAPIVNQSGLSTPLQYGKDNLDGYTSYISPAIGSTNATIIMTEMHMMSKIKIVLKTTAQPTATNNAIVLYDGSATQKGSTIAITNFYTEGDVNMGSGKVSPKTLNETAAGVQISSPATTSSSAFYKTEYTETNEFSYSVVPQSLVEGTRKVGLVITTPDKNQYFVVNDLSKIAVSGTNNSKNQGSVIDCWYPGHQYIYTITLTKAGIANITCSVVDWIDITAKDQNISLED